MSDNFQIVGWVIQNADKDFLYSGGPRWTKKISEAFQFASQKAAEAYVEGDITFNQYRLDSEGLRGPIMYSNGLNKIFVAPIQIGNVANTFEHDVVNIDTESPPAVITIDDIKHALESNGDDDDIIDFLRDILSCH